MPYLETVQELLEAKEGEHVQFKEAKNRFDFGEAAKCCCALANNGGGKLVFGITDKRPRSIVGSAAFDQPERTRMGLIEKLKVNVDFQIFNYERKRILAFDVKSRPIGLPVQYDGVAWIYEGDTLKPMPEDMRRSIYEETGGDFSGTICAGATVNDLDEIAIENFRTKWIEKSGKKQLATLSKEQLLHDCGAITDDGVTYAALILVAVIWYMFKYTELGMHIRAVGESPDAAESVGIHVKRVKYTALSLSGILTGMAGAFLSMGYVGLFSAGMTAGRGYIALATQAIAAGNAVIGMLASLLFGFCQSLANYLQSSGIPLQFIQMMPYLIIIIAYTVYCAMVERNKKKKQMRAAAGK